MAVNNEDDKSSAYITNCLKMKRYSKPVILPPPDATIFRMPRDGPDEPRANPIDFLARRASPQKVLALLSFKRTGEVNQSVDIAPAVYRFLDHVSGIRPFTGIFNVYASNIHHADSPVEKGIYYLFLPEANTFAGVCNPVPVPIGYNVNWNDIVLGFVEMFALGWTLAIHRAMLAWAVKHGHYEGAYLFDSYMDAGDYNLQYKGIWDLFNRDFSYNDLSFVTAPDCQHVRGVDFLCMAKSLLSCVLEVNDALSNLLILHNDGREQFLNITKCGEVGNYYRACFKEPLKIQPKLTYGHVFDHVFASQFGNAWFDGVVTPLNLNQVANFIPRTELYLFAGCRLQVFNPKSVYVGRSMPLQVEVIGDVTVYNEDDLTSAMAYDQCYGFSIVLPNSPIPRTLKYCYAHDCCENVLLAVDFTLKATVHRLNFISHKELEPKVFFDDLCDLKIHGASKKSMDQIMCDIAGVTDIEWLKKYCDEHGLTYRGAPLSMYLSGLCFSTSEMVALHNRCLKLLPRPKTKARVWPADWNQSGELEYEQWMLFKNENSTLISCDKVDINMSRRNFDVFDLYEAISGKAYPNVYISGSGETFENPWRATFARVRQLFKLFFEYSNSFTTYQVFANWFFYCLRCETSFLYGSFLVRAGVLLLKTSNEYKDFCSMHDYVVLLTNRGVGLMIDTQGCQGLLLGIIILGQWGPRRNEPFSRERAYLECIKAIIALMNDPGYPWTSLSDHNGKPIPGSESTHQLNFDPRSFDEVKSFLKGGKHGDHHLVQKFKEHLDRIGCPWTEDMFEAPIGGCWIGATTHLDGLIELWSSMAQQFVDKAEPRLIQAMQHWVSPVTREWWTRAWKTVGTSGAPNPPVGGPYTKKISLLVRK